MNQRAAATGKVFFLIRTAMAAGVCTFIAVAWFIRGRGEAPVAPAATLGSLTTVMYASVALAAAVVMALRLRLASVEGQTRRSLSVIGWAVGEFAALFGGVLFFMTGELRHVLPGAVVFALALAAIPLPRD